MSNLAGLMKATQLNKRIYDPSEVIAVEQAGTMLRPPGERYAYTFTATFGYTSYLNEKAALGAQLEEVLGNAKRSVIEAVFGEFRAPLLSLERALYDRNYDTALEIARRVQKQMFEI